MSFNLLNKTLVIGIIFLLIGIAIQPVIIADVSIESDNSELVEITVEICEVDKTYNHTVMLTQQQVVELENLIKNFKIELDAPDSIDEAEVIFKNTVVSLNELGLLPEGISVTEAQRLVTGGEQNPRIVKFLERYYSKNQKSLGIYENTLCLILGDTSATFSQGPIGRLTLGTLRLLSYFFHNFLYHTAKYFIGFLMLMSLIWFFNPLLLGYELSLGYSYGTPGGPISEPAKGWIYTRGLQGTRIWSGTFYGDLPLLPFLLTLVGCYPGVFGFTGVKIIDFYMGFALWVKIKDA